MPRRWSWLAAFLVMFVFSPRPARAESWGDWSDWAADGERYASAARAVEYLYLGGGTAVFGVADIVFARQRQRIPLAWGALQMAYGTTLVMIGAAVAPQPDQLEYAALIPLGAALVAVPIIDWSIRGKKKDQRATVGVVGTRLVVSGTF